MSIKMSVSSIWSNIFFSQLHRSVSIRCWFMFFCLLIIYFQTGCVWQPSRNLHDVSLVWWVPWLPSSWPSWQLYAGQGVYTHPLSCPKAGKDFLKVPHSCRTSLRAGSCIWAEGASSVAMRPRLCKWLSTHVRWDTAHLTPHIILKLACTWKQKARNILTSTWGQNPDTRACSQPTEGLVDPLVLLFISLFTLKFRASRSFFSFELSFPSSNWEQR